MPSSTSSSRSAVSASIMPGLHWNDFSSYSCGLVAYWLTFLVRLLSCSISQGVQLFKLFGYLHAAGNIMVLFSDAQDTQVILEGRPLESILAEARENHVPIYLVRTGYGKKANFESNTADPIWSKAVRDTGGQFYAAANEDVILQALKEIDRAATGNVVRTRYGSRQPHFTFFALLHLVGVRVR